MASMCPAQELFPGNFRPTPTHFFIRLLHQKGLLQRCFSQNIDSLESLAGLPRDAVVAAHGNFDGVQVGALPSRVLRLTHPVASSMSWARASRTCPSTCCFRVLSVKTITNASIVTARNWLAQLCKQHADANHAQTR